MERVQWKATNKAIEERLKELDLKRKLRRDITLAYNYLKYYHKSNRAKLCVLLPTGLTKNNCHSLQLGRFRLSIRK